jgi:hypothetical protein
MLVSYIGNEMMMNWLWGKAYPSFVYEQAHGFYSFSNCPYCFKIDMDIGTGSLSFLGYLVMDFSIHSLLKNVYSMGMADLSIFDVFHE